MIRGGVSMSEKKARAPTRAIAVPSSRAVSLAPSANLQSHPADLALLMNHHSQRMNACGVGTSSASPSATSGSSFGRPSLVRGTSYIPGGREARIERATLEKKVWDHLTTTDFRVNETPIKDFGLERLERMRYAPSRSDFAEMFGHIMRGLGCIHYKPQKIEDEMPKIMSGLGYPIQLKHSTMKTIGAPHVMTQLYHALAWLVDAVHIFASVTPAHLMLWADEGDGNKSTVAYGYAVTRCRTSAGVGYNDLDPTLHPDDADRLRCLVEAAGDLKNVEAMLRDRERAANETFLALSAQPDQTTKLKVDVEKSKADIQQFLEYKKSLENTAAILNKQKMEREATRAKREEEVNAIKAQIAAKEQQITLQKITGDEARDLRLRIQEAAAIAHSLKADTCEVMRARDELFTANISSGSKLRKMHDSLVAFADDVLRMFRISSEDLPDYGDVLTQMRNVSPNQPDFPHFLQRMQEMVRAIESVVCKKISELDRARLSALDENIKFRSQLDRDTQRLNQFRRQQSDTRHRENLTRGDWATEEDKLKMELDLIQDKVEYLRRTNKETVTIEELSKSKVEAQNELRKMIAQHADALQEAIARLQPLTADIDSLMNCIAQLAENKARLGAEFEAFVHDGSPSKSASE